MKQPPRPTQLSKSGPPPCPPPPLAVFGYAHRGNMQRVSVCVTPNSSCPVCLDQSAADVLELRPEKHSRTKSCLLLLWLCYRLTTGHTTHNSHPPTVVKFTRGSVMSPGGGGGGPVCYVAPLHWSDVICFSPRCNSLNGPIRSSGVAQKQEVDKLHDFVLN